MNRQQHAPVFTAFREMIRGHRVAGTIDFRVGPVADAYIGHVARCVADREMTLADGLVLTNAVVKLAVRCVPLPEARTVPREPVAPCPTCTGT